MNKEDKVLVSNNGTLEVGIITRVYTHKGQTVYDVFTERGSYFTKITTDSQKRLIFINVKATKKFGSKIQTKLTIDYVNKKINSYEITEGDSELPEYNDN